MIAIYDLFYSKPSHICFEIGRGDADLSDQVSGCVSKMCYGGGGGDADGDEYGECQGSGFGSGEGYRAGFGHGN